MEQIYNRFCFLAGRQDAKDAFGSWCSDDDYVDRRRFTLLHRIVLGLRSENSQYQKDRSSVAEHLRQALEASSASINAVDAGGETPLIWAVGRGDGKAVQTLLTYGADPNIAARHRSRPIHIAYTSLTCLEALLSSKVEVDARDAYNRTARHTMAYSQTDTRFLQLLLGAGADINARNKRGITALSAALRGHRSENVRFLLQHRADPNTLDGLGYTPLFDSIYRNNHQSLEFLFEFGADHTFWTSELGTVLHEAAWKGDIRTLQILTETRLAGIDIYLTDHDDRTALDKLYKRPDFTHELELAFLALLDSITEGDERITSVEDDDSHDSVEDKLGTDDFTDAPENPSVDEQGD